MNIVTFETAKRLKEAGFPQPENFTLGSFYYPSIGGEPVLVHVKQFSGVGITRFFAPSATDILKDLNNENIYLCFEEGMFKVFENPDYDTFILIGKSDNPAEACAAAWLAKNENANKPNPESYGYYSAEGFDDLPSGWQIEGGEEEYYKALERWKQSQKP